MEPMSILLYVGSLAIVVLTIMLSIMIFELIMMLRRMNRIFEYADHVRQLLAMWEELPTRIFGSIMEKFFKE